MELILIVILSYLLGSIPFSLIVARAYGKNLYKIGSKNIGAANVFRATGKIEALLMALIGDIGKGALALFLTRQLCCSCLEDNLILLQAVAAFFVVIGHNWPIFLKFKGGRGLASLAGIILFLNWKAIILVLLVLAIFILLTELAMKKKLKFKGGLKGKIKGIFSLFISQVAGRMIGIGVAAILIYIFYPEVFKIAFAAAVLSGIKHIKRTKTFLKGRKHEG